MLSNGRFFKNAVLRAWIGVTVLFQHENDAAASGDGSNFSYYRDMGPGVSSGFRPSPE
jgi:hypothetical protein